MATCSDGPTQWLSGVISQPKYHNTKAIAEPNMLSFHVMSCPEVGRSQTQTSNVFNFP